MAMTIEVFSHALMGLSPNTFLFLALFLPVLLMVRVLCSACRTCFYVFSKHLVTNPGVCLVLQGLQACALYNNWWPMLSALMYVVVPMPCLFFGGGSTQFLLTRESDGWINAAKFLTGASTVGSIAIPIILRHAHMIETPAMWIEFFSFFIFICTVMCFHRASLEDEW